MQSDTPDPAILVADLRQRWAHLKDVDRAMRVRQIHLAGLSLRELANELNRSPTLIRRLNDVAQASKLDLLQARTIGISTRELARRGAEEMNLQAKKAQESAEV